MNFNLSAKLHIFFNGVYFSMEKITQRLEIFGNLCILEVIHLVHHADGGVDDREGTESASSFTQTETEME